MQLEVTLMIGYKCGAEDTGESPLLPHTVGYVHSEYLSCTTPPQGFTAQEVSKRDYAQPRSPFWLLHQILSI